MLDTEKVRKRAYTYLHWGTGLFLGLVPTALGLEVLNDVLDGCPILEAQSCEVHTVTHGEETP
jgi:hypothetical protein